MLDNDLVCIGTTTRGLELVAPVVMSVDDRRRHIHLIGKTGTGKTTLLKTLIFDDLVKGRNFALLDPLGGLAEAVVDAVPKERNDEVIYIDPSDLEHPVAFNPLDRVPHDLRHLVADQVVNAFMHIWDSDLAGSPRLAYILYNGLRLLLDAPQSTLLGLPRLLADDRYRARLLEHCEDPVVKAYWANEFAGYSERFRSEAISPVQNKIGMLLSPPALRNIIGQHRSTIDVRRVMNSGGVLIANLSKGKIGATGSHLLGAFLATTIAQVAEERASIPRDQHLDFTLYADEVQNFATTSFSQTLSEARNWKLSVVLAHQFLDQLPDAVKNAIIANCGSFIVFKIGSQDTRLLAAELGIENTRTLSDTRNFSAWARLLLDGNTTDPIFLETIMAEAPAHGRAAKVIAHTRARHTRHRRSVEQSIGFQLHS